MLIVSGVFKMLIDPGREVAQYLRLEEHCEVQLSAYTRVSNMTQRVADKIKQYGAIHTITDHEALELLQLIHDARITIGLDDLESTAVSVAFGVVFDHDGVLQSIAHVFGFVGFDAQFGLFAEPLSLSCERVIAVCSVVAGGGVDDSSRRRGFVCCGHDVGTAALPVDAASQRIVHAA